MPAFVAAGRAGGNQTSQAVPRAFGARGSGSVDDRFAFEKAQSIAGDFTVDPGTYLIGSDWTLPGGKVMRVDDGGLLKPASGQTITITGDIIAGGYQIFDLSAGGSVVFTRGLARAEWWGADPDADIEANDEQLDAYLDATEGAEIVRRFGIGRDRGPGIDLRDYGVNGGGHDDTKGFMRAFTDARADFTHPSVRGTVNMPAGALNVGGEEPVPVPSWTDAGESWDKENAVRFKGSGKENTVLTVTVPEAAFQDPNWAPGVPVGPRGQNAGFYASDFTLIGPQNLGIAADGFRLSNTRRAIFERIAFRGFNGTAVDLHSYQKGGLWGATFRDCDFGENKHRTLGDEILYHLQDFADYGVRYGVRLRGPYHVNGKINDLEFDNCRATACAIGFMMISGFGDEEEISFGGSTENVRVSGGQFYLEPYRKMEQGVLSAVDDATEVSLRLTDVFYSLDDDFNGFVLGLRDDDGRWHYRYIFDFVGATRTCVVLDPFPFTPTTSTLYRIGYADAEAAAIHTEPATLQHVIRADTNNSVRLFGVYSEEAQLFTCRPAFTPRIFNVGPRYIVHDGRFAMKTDGSYLSEAAGFSDGYIGADDTPVNALVATLLLADGRFPNEEAALLISRAIESEGVTLHSGEPVSIQADQQFDEAVNWTANTGHVPQKVAWNPYRKTFKDTKRATAPVAGLVKVKVRASVAPGDSLMPMAAGYFEPFPVLNLVNPWRMASTHARKGSTANWVVDPASDTPVLASLGASETAQRVIVHLGGLNVGDYIRKFAVVGRIESGGNAVALTATLYRAEVAAGSVTHTALSPAVALSGIVADTKLDGDTAAATSSLSAFAEVQQDRWYYVLIEATTGASCGIEIGGIAVQLDDRGRRVLHGRVAVAIDTITAPGDLAAEATSELDIGEAWCWAIVE